MRLLAIALVLALSPLSTLGQQRGSVPRAAPPPQPLLVDRIVAVVGKDVVTLSELGERREYAERQLRRQGTPLPDRSLLERQILERLILDKAQLQLARESGVRVEEIQLDRALERIAESNNVTLAAFRAQLEKEGVPFDKFRDEVREQIQLRRLREREVDDRIEVSDGEIDLYLEETKATSGGRTEYNVAHILVRLPDQASPEKIEEARKRAEKARSEAVAGGDFGKLAASYSDGPDGLQGGLLGWRAEERLPEIFTSVLKNMKPGDVSPVLRSPGGFHVIKLIDRRGAGQAQEVEQAHVRHILVRTSEVVSEADAKRRLAELRERIVTGGADFAELARLYSQDGSASKGGDLGWVLPGDTVPEFERAFMDLKPGQISQPIRSPFGYHLIQLLERREAGLTQERKRMQARLTLKERKADEAYQEWLRQLRDRTYVEVRLEDK